MTTIDLKVSKDKLLLTPGPLTTSYTVREAAFRDLGSRDSEFISIVQDVRQKLLTLAHVGRPDYESIIIQGSGTFGIESVISSALPTGGKLLNIINGAYGRRISQIARIHSIPVLELNYNENQWPDLLEIENALANDPEITHVAIIHGETTTGLINPIKEIGNLTAKYGKPLIVDAMSTFGAYDIDIKALNISYLISSSNKCIEGIPGFSIIIARTSELVQCEGKARTLSLDLYDQWDGLKLNGQFRFTPPVQSILSFNKALDQLEREGGVIARAIRYSNNNSILVNGMRNLGFKVYLPDNLRGYIITSFIYPQHPQFTFEAFYNRLNEKGFVIYPGKLSKVDCFRIGNIGQVFPNDLSDLIVAVKEVLNDMKVNLNDRI